MFGRVDVQIIQNLPLIFSLFCFFFILGLIISIIDPAIVSSSIVSRINRLYHINFACRLHCAHIVRIRVWWPLFKFHLADWDEPDRDAADLAVEYT